MKKLKKLKPYQIIAILISAVLLIGATIVIVIHFKDTLFCESTLIIIIGILFAIFCLGGFYLLLKGK